MSDEALNVHLDWLDDCAKQNKNDYEPLSERIAKKLLASSDLLLPPILADEVQELVQLEEELERLKVDEAIEFTHSLRVGERIALLEAELTDYLKICQNYVTDLEALQAGNALLEAKLTAIECSDCGLTMLVCECDDLENG